MNFGLRSEDISDDATQYRLTILLHLFTAS